MDESLQALCFVMVCCGFEVLKRLAYHYLDLHVGNL